MYTRFCRLGVVYVLYVGASGEKGQARLSMRRQSYPADKRIAQRALPRSVGWFCKFTGSLRTKALQVLRRFYRAR